MVTSTDVEGAFADASERRLEPHAAGLPFMAQSAMNEDRVTPRDGPLYEAAHTRLERVADFTAFWRVFASKGE
jgi:hypothetical protein